jgi:hypothetical protein
MSSSSQKPVASKKAADKRPLGKGGKTAAGPTLPIASTSRGLLSDVRVQDGSLTIPFGSHEELAAKLMHLATHVLDAQQLGVAPAIVPTGRHTIPFPDARQIVSGCAKSQDWSMSVGDLVADVDQFRACIADRLITAGYSVPLDVGEKVSAKSTLDDVLGYVLEATK